MLPKITNTDGQVQSSRRISTKDIYDLSSSENEYGRLGQQKPLSSVRLPPKLKKSKFQEVTKNDVRIHLSCSDAMRQTQYDKLVSAVNKFDTQRIKKAIRDGKINSLLENERNNPNLAKTMKKSKHRSIARKPKHIDSPDMEKIENARRRNKDFLNKKGFFSSLGSESMSRSPNARDFKASTDKIMKTSMPHTMTNRNIFDSKRRTLDLRIPHNK